MSDHHQMLEKRVSGIELAEIEVLMLIKRVPSEHLQRVLESKGVTRRLSDWELKSSKIPARFFFKQSSWTR